ncbi:MAG: bifunctional (p)ppGpp synthetase/guanosine-3',5'-bis(diphosphate) 3'-pyrophosphohydrolase [Clostridia bacterium]|nr:bifunctional (p)ppGpp synthetase/guanosine-3',5'-bis(diphosphate) 3'-pyrophosphohydrolase [Clostridia bacterium]
MYTKSEFLNKIAQLNKNYNLELIGRAFDTAEKLHEGQFRRSGEPYFMHPQNVAIILAEMGMDNETICGGLLHDVVEDTEYTHEMMIESFGENVALLVDGVTKLGEIKFDNKTEEQAENFRKMFLAMSKDIRVLIIKLADRLHNMRTLEHMPSHKQLEKSRETIDVYAPLASRLGIYAVKFELEDLAFKYLEPEIYQSLGRRVQAKKEESAQTIKQVIDKIDDSLKDSHINYDIYGRTKQLYSIYKKMLYQNKQLDEIFDLTALRILVSSVKDCYAILGLVHTLWMPIPGRFKDYIAMPKPNRYQSLHTTVIGDNGNPFEIQIRTYDMHKVAEYGIAAHWKYKEGDTSDTNDDEVKLSWLRQSLEWQQDISDSKEFMDNLKMDLFASQVYVFTPRGDVFELPVKATPLDFAFKVHTEVGKKCTGAKVNGKMVTIDYTLQNGDIVEIITNPNASGPSIDWLKIAKSPSARNKIRQYLRKANKDNVVEQGKDALDRHISKRGYDPNKVAIISFLNRAVKEHGYDNLSDAYIQIANGGSLLSKFAGSLISYYDEVHKPELDEDKEAQEKLEKATNNKSIRDRNLVQSSIIVNNDPNQKNLLVRTARCCNPVPGDDIVGFITKGRGISVHRADCSNVKGMGEEELSRMIDVEWADIEMGKTYDAHITIIMEHKKGMVAAVSKLCEELDISITAMNLRTNTDDNAVMDITLALAGTHQMQRVLRQFRNIDGVIQVYRPK